MKRLLSESFGENEDLFFLAPYKQKGLRLFSEALFVFSDAAVITFHRRHLRRRRGFGRRCG